MKDGRSPASFDGSPTTNRASAEASPSLWQCNNEGQHLDDESLTRVIWKASQPQDPVLSRLMEDASSPGNRLRPVRTKSWTPSPNSCMITASSSACNVSVRSSKPHRTNKRRTSGTDLPQEAAVPSHDDFDKSVQKIVALFPIVSKQADENAKREQEELRQKRRREKKASRLAKDSSTTKKRRNPTGDKGKQRVIGEDQEEEMSTVAEDSPISEDMYSDGSWLREVVTARAGPPQNMPPPSFVPLRKSWSGDGSFPSAFTQRLGRPSCNPDEAGREPEELSFNASSFTATSTPRPLLAATSTDSTRETGSESKPRDIISRDSPTSSQYISSSPVPTILDPGSQAPLRSTFARLDHNISHNLVPTPSQPGPYVLRSQAPAPGVQSLHKPSGPPVLGMRRLPQTQNFSVSQDRPLPVKREKFRVPFAKPKSDNQNQAGTSTRPSNQDVSKPASQARPSNEHSQKISTCSSLTRGDIRLNHGTFSQQAQPSQHQSPHSSPTNVTTEHARTIQTDANRSSSPAADADSSMDYDMGIDPEELERICSAYD